ncbi:hypothetical protein BJ165DRAFT_1529491 [Panaeolus papilionaceus]|nr:hypothetical protein BJ165DRAFT_1529491 [Panaeolus papilionaceus]
MASHAKSNHLGVHSTSPTPEPARKKAKNMHTSSASGRTTLGKAAAEEAEDMVDSSNSDKEVDELLLDKDELEDEDGVGAMTDKNRSDLEHIRKSIKAYPSYVNKKRNGTTELRIAPDGCVYLSKTRFCAVVEKDRCTNRVCKAQTNCYKRVNYKQENQACTSCAMRGRTCKSTLSGQLTFVDLSTNTRDGGTSQTGVVNDLLAAFQDGQNKTNELLQAIAKQGEFLLALQSAALGISPETLSDPLEFDKALRRINKGAQQTSQETDKTEITQGSGQADVVVNDADGDRQRGDRQQASPSVSAPQPALHSQPASQPLIGTSHLKRKTSASRKTARDVE